MVGIVLWVFFFEIILLISRINSNEAVPKWLVDHINSHQNHWKASKKNFFGNMLLSEANFFIMKDDESAPQISEIERKKIFSQNIQKRRYTKQLPNYFMFYDRFPQCDKKPRNQLSCGSCWSVSLVQSCGDRFCQENVLSGSHNVTTIEFSPQELVSCYKERINPVYNYCGGAEHVLALGYLLQSTGYGIVSDNCMKYTLYNKGQKIPCPSVNEEKCPNSDYEHFNEDRFFISGATEITDVTQAMNEIYNNGPILTKYMVYQDFYAYSGGIYIKTPGATQVGLHSVAIVGFGEENSIPYWIVKNSWGEYSGSEQYGNYKGYFRIRRGTNECRIEEFMSGCIPLLTCSYYCYGVCENEQHVCSGHGDCVNANQCVCYDGYHGAKCAHEANPQVSCFGVNSSNPAVCNTHGTCSGMEICECDREYSGEDCVSYKSCFGIDFEYTMEVCNGAGECNGYNSCECIEGFSGGECEIDESKIWIYVFIVVGMVLLVCAAIVIGVIVVVAVSLKYCKNFKHWKNEWNKMKNENKKTIENIKMNTKKNNNNNNNNTNNANKSGSGGKMKLSKKEEKAISNLIKLGFDRHSCIQAYFACEKNENNAANFLFQTKMEEEQVYYSDEESGGFV